MTARELLEELESCGIDFEMVQFWNDGGDPIPDWVDLVELDPNVWSTELVPTWPILSDCPAASVVQVARKKWDEDPAFRRAMLEAYTSRICDGIRGTHDWDVP